MTAINAKERKMPMLTFEAKCTGNTQAIEGPHTTTFVGEKNQEVKIVSPELHFKVGEVYAFSVAGKFTDTKKA